MKGGGSNIVATGEKIGEMGWWLLKK
jgi:hypothetical protein